VKLPINREIPCGAIHVERTAPELVPNRNRPWPSRSLPHNEIAGLVD
jgi:hypothetical protein